MRTAVVFAECSIKNNGSSTPSEHLFVSAQTTRSKNSDSSFDSRVLTQVKQTRMIALFVLLHIQRYCSVEDYPGIGTDGFQIVWSDSGQAEAARETTTSQQMIPAFIASNDSDPEFWKDWADWQRAVFVVALLIALLLLVVVLAIAIYLCCENRL